jgi:hypothetical protein
MSIESHLASVQAVLSDIDPEHIALLIPIVFLVAAAVLGGVIATVVNRRMRLDREAREQSRRELAAYVAEGSISTEDAIRLMEAGERRGRKGYASGNDAGPGQKRARNSGARFDVKMGVEHEPAHGHGGVPFASIRPAPGPQSQGTVAEDSFRGTKEAWRAWARTVARKAHEAGDFAERVASTPTNSQAAGGRAS